MSVLNIKPAEQCNYDMLSLGEIMLRLDPGEGASGRARVQGLGRRRRIQRRARTAPLLRPEGRRWPARSRTTTWAGCSRISSCRAAWRSVHVQWVTFDGMGRNRVRA